MRIRHLVFTLTLPCAALIPQSSIIAGRGPVPDEVFLQEIASQVPSPTPITSLAFLGTNLYAGSAMGLRQLSNRSWSVVDPRLEQPCRCLGVAQNTLWVTTSNALFAVATDGVRKSADFPCTGVAEFRGQLLASTPSRLLRKDGPEWKPATTNEPPFSISQISSHQELLWVLGPGRLAPFDGIQFGGRDAYDSHSDQAWDWGDLPSKATHQMLPVDSQLWVATDRGIGVLRGMAMHAITGEDGLCIEETTSLATGFAGDVWIGTQRGAIRHVDGRFQYFAGRRWLPSDRVHAIARLDTSIFLATDAGLGIIRYVPMTLESKASYYERHLVDWGQKRLGLVQKLEWDDPSKEFVREAGDNDGGYSGDYLAAESYRYAVTRNPEALRNAQATFQGLRRLQTITGIPGFPARSIWLKGETGHKSTGGSGGYPAEWHTVKADPRFEWKADTSSDEICSHFYSMGIFLQLAADETEKLQVRNHLTHIARHLIDHGWQLHDLDGKPTRWGRWDPEYFKTDEGRFDRGLQSLELLSFMKMAEAISGETAFNDAYQRLVRLGYPGHTLRQRSSFPPENVAHFEDQLAFWCYWNLLRLEKDPALHAVYRRSYERSFEAVRCERNPWFQFLYGALTGQDCDANAAADHLREWPIDLRIWSYANSHRRDLKTPRGLLAVKGGRLGLSPRETEPMRWDHWTMQEDGGADGRDVVEPSAWLLAYWMGRHEGFIAAPAPQAVVPSIPALRDGTRGATPYTGPTPHE